MPVIPQSFFIARLRAVDNAHGFPYLSMALFSLVPVFTDKVSTLATDRWWRCYINPGFFAKLTVDEGAMVLIHEVWHLLKLDWDRAADMHVKLEEQHMWNIASDISINQQADLYKRLPTLDWKDEQGNELSCTPCTAKEYGLEEGLFTEQMFQKLRENRPDLLSKVVYIELNGPGQHNKGQHPAPGTGTCGSCAGGGPRPWEEPPPGSGEGVSGGISEARSKIIRAQVAQAIQDEKNTGRGNMPAGWERWASEVLQPRVNWRQELPPTIKSFAAMTSGGTIANWQRIGRRKHQDARICTPARRRAVQRVSMIIDTSGSMSDRYLAQALAEVDGVLRALGNQVDVAVYFTDAATAEVQKVHSARELKPLGGGGTDMGEGFLAIETDSRRRPELAPGFIICVTDGYTPWPETPPSVPVVILLLGACTAKPHWIDNQNYKVVHLTEV